MRTETHATAALVAREHYGKLVAYLASRFRNLALAEDCLSDALLKALEVWPRTGIPTNPEGWLFRTAHRRILDALRHEQVAAHYATEASSILSAPADERVDYIFPDERLKLLYVCAHPAISAELHTPLMLQTVLGLEAKQIAASFMVSPAAMAQKLVRAKNKIRLARIPFTEPEAAELPSRSAAVLNAIYALYTTGHDHTPALSSLATEALYLARLMDQLSAHTPESLGLHALLLFCEARRPAINDQIYIPLYAQDTSLWNHPQLREAEAKLSQAAQARQMGRFQLEAAIQSAHIQACLTQQPQWPAICRLYEGLITIAPSIGASIGYAGALCQANQAAQALQLLDTLPTERIVSHQPYWATRAETLKQLAKLAEAKTAYMTAMGLSSNTAIRQFLQKQLDQLTH